MTNIIKWFDDFPSRALDLLAEIEPLATERDRIGTLSLMVAPSLIIAPYERLQTYARRMNPQADYLRFPEAHRDFDAVMRSCFGAAPFWDLGVHMTMPIWRRAQVTRNINDPIEWETVDGHGPNQDAFWLDDIFELETRWVWKALRDSLAHWNVATSDADYRDFSETGTMERLLFYRSDRDEGPWDVVAVSPDAFFSFLKGWVDFLGRGPAHEVLIASAAE